MKSTIVKEKVTLEAIGRLIEKSVSKLATKEEVAKLATKEEVAKLATKEEISKLATKDELDVAISKLATKEEISKLATKDEMNKSIDDFAGAVKKGFDEVYEKIEKIEFKIDRMDTRFTNQLDYISLWYPTKFEFVGLDARVKKIEKKLGVKS